MPHPIMHSHTQFSLNIIAHSIRSTFLILISFKTTLFFTLCGKFLYKFHSTYLCPNVVFSLLNIENSFGLGWKNQKRAVFEPLKFAIVQYHILSGFYFLDCISIKFRAIIVIPVFVCSLFSIENRKINTKNHMKYITSSFKYIFSSVCPTCAHLIYHG